MYLSCNMDLHFVRMPYSLAIFDLDGTLVDSFPWFWRTINEVADKFGFRRVNDDELEGCARHRRARSWPGCNCRCGRCRLSARHMRRLKAEAAANTPLFAGVPEMLQQLTDAGIKLALVTSDSRANARRKLGAAAGPDLVLRLRRLAVRQAVAVSPCHQARGDRQGGIIAIGDEVRDVEAARAVGISAGRWRGDAAPQALRAMQPDFMFERMEDIREGCLGPTIGRDNRVIGETRGECQNGVDILALSGSGTSCRSTPASARLSAGSERSQRQARSHAGTTCMRSAIIVILANTSRHGVTFRALIIAKVTVAANPKIEPLACLTPRSRPPQIPSGPRKTRAASCSDRSTRRSSAPAHIWSAAAASRWDRPSAGASGSP